MPNETVAEENRSLGVIPSAPWRVSAVTVMPGFRLAVTFKDHSNGIVDMSTLVNSPEAGVFSALRDPDLFAKAGIELGVVTWPNGADLDPVWMHEEIAKQSEWRIA
jgi:hypothetical protein